MSPRSEDFGCSSKFKIVSWSKPSMTFCQFTCNKFFMIHSSSFGLLLLFYHKIRPFFKLFWYNQSIIIQKWSKNEKKDERQLLIREIIQNEKLSTQKRNSRPFRSERGGSNPDHLIQGPTRNRSDQGKKEKGGLYYKLADEPDRTDIFRLIAQYAQVVSRAEFTLVVRTELGEAAILANAVDEILDDQILGTVAGANTLLIVCKDQEVAQTVQQTILQHSSH